MEDTEKQAIVDFHQSTPWEGYRRLTFIMRAADVVALSPASVKHYNEVRLHSALGYVKPLTKLLGKEREVFTSRDQQLEATQVKRRTVAVAEPCRPLAFDVSDEIFPTRYFRRDISDEIFPTRYFRNAKYLRTGEGTDSSPEGTVPSATASFFVN